MSALGQKQTLGKVRLMSALPPKADIRTQPRIAFCWAGKLIDIDRGSPTGPATPNHRLVSKSGIPASAIVGTSGWALERFSAAVEGPQHRIPDCLGHTRPYGG